MDLVQIGVIHSPYDRENNKPPHQGVKSDELVTIEVYDQYIDGLKGLEEGYLIDLIYWGDQSDRTVLISNKKGKEDGEIRGVFSLRAPVRPNPILINTCRILEIEGGNISVKGMDAYDGSPLIDIKISMK